MNLLKMLFIASAAMVACCPSVTILADSPSLDSSEAQTLSYLREFSKYKWDIYRGSGAQSGPMAEEPTLLALAAAERLHMDTYKSLLDFYAIDDPVVGYDYWAYSDGFLTQDLDWRTYFVGWSLRPGQFENCAYLEEMTISLLNEAIAGTDEMLLDETYTAMMGYSYSNLVILATWLHDDPADYRAQLLEQEVVDQIIANTAPLPLPIGEGFVINAGLNDAWFDPTTNGQGFFIAVFPESETLVLSWLTYDTQSPAMGTETHLGDPCQRWFIAQGHYDGANADLVVHSSSNGIFNQATPRPTLHEIGTIHLRFEHCNSGMMSYDLPAVSASGEIRIRRVSNDNVSTCEENAIALAR